MQDFKSKSDSEEERQAEDKKPAGTLSALFSGFFSFFGNNKTDEQAIRDSASGNDAPDFEPLSLSPGDNAILNNHSTQVVSFPIDEKNFKKKFKNGEFKVFLGGGRWTSDRKLSHEFAQVVSFDKESLEKFAIELYAKKLVRKPPYVRRSKEDGKNYREYHNVNDAFGGTKQYFMRIHRSSYPYIAVKYQLKGWEKLTIFIIEGKTNTFQKPRMNIEFDKVQENVIDESIWLYHSNKQELQSFYQQLQDYGYLKSSRSDSNKAKKIEVEEGEEDSGEYYISIPKRKFRDIQTEYSIPNKGYNKANIEQMGEQDDEESHDSAKFLMRGIGQSQ